MYQFKNDLNHVLARMAVLWGGNLVKMMRMTKNLRKGAKIARKRRGFHAREGLTVPSAIGLSPTMECNLTCIGCYARFHPKDDEVTTEDLNRFIGEAVDHGVFLFVVTGGEPYMQKDLLSICERFPRTLFLTVTNGTTATGEISAAAARMKNVFPILSLEGNEIQTDERRGEGVYQGVLNAMRIYREHGVPFGFSSVVTTRNIETLASISFVREMIDHGAVFGIYNEYIPVNGEEMYLVPDKARLEELKRFAEAIREREPIVLLNMPGDEYDENDRCLAVGRGSVHVNAQGFVEPCPFAHYARENIKTHSFREILESPFLKALREHSTALTKGDIGCALVSNGEILKAIAEEHEAVSTNVEATEAIDVTVKGMTG
jgi:MoaA/NifB/PqqE/SkfB family radical SAM enzyme